MIIIEVIINQILLDKVGGEKKLKLRYAEVVCVKRQILILWHVNLNITFYFVSLSSAEETGAENNGSRAAGEGFICWHDFPASFISISV